LLTCRGAEAGDRSTYATAAAYSQGIAHVIVNGVPIVSGGEFANRGLLQGRRILIGTPMPGRPVRAPRRP
jgi:hypothetical protein